MSKENTIWKYNTNDIFPDNDEKSMTIPPEVAHAADLKPGDKLKIKYGDQGTVIIEKVTKEKENDE